MRSPLATAPMTRAISVEGCIRSPIRLFTESMHAAQDLRGRSKVRALIDLAFLTDGSADTLKLRAIRSFSSRMSLSVSLTFPASPTFSTGILTLKSPLRKAIRVLSSCRTSTVSATGTAVAFFIRNMTGSLDTANGKFVTRKFDDTNAWI